MMRAVCQISGAYNLASVIDPACGAVIPTKGPNVGKDSPLPDESMVGEIARSIGEPDDLTTAVESTRETESATQSSEICHFAALPEEWVQSGNSCGTVWNGVYE